VYPVLALLAGACAIMLAGWAQTHRAGQVVPYPGFSILLLASFWAASVIAARVVFAAMEQRRTWRRSASLVPFLLAAAIAITGLAVGQIQTARVGIFLLAAVLCAAFFPLPASARADGPMLLSLVGAAGVIGLYPAGLGIAGSTTGNFQSGGISLLGIFVVTGSIGIAASLVATRLRAWWPAAAVGPQSGPYRRGGAVPVGAQVSSGAPEPRPAARTTQSAPRPRQETMPPHSRSASSATPSSKPE
jgi:hypothetical protein